MISSLYPDFGDCLHLPQVKTHIQGIVLTGPSKVQLGTMKTPSLDQHREQL